jgi:hypothetical protein
MSNNPQEGIDWIPHNGGACPLKDEEVSVWEYTLRGGTVAKVHLRPSEFKSYWRHDKEVNDIIAYRVLKWKLGFGPQKQPNGTPVASPLTRQEGGSHYKDCKMQPVEFIHANKLNFLEGSVVKRICRHRRKNGAEDIRKAIHELELILALEYPEGTTRHPSCPD